MTLSDLQTRDAKGQTFPQDLRDFAPTVWHRTTKFAVLTHMGKERVYGGSATPPSRTGEVPASPFLEPLSTPTRFTLDHKH